MPRDHFGRRMLAFFLRCHFADHCSSYHPIAVSLRCRARCDGGMVVSQCDSTSGKAPKPRLQRDQAGHDKADT